jgi:hypothetical protein
MCSKFHPDMFRQEVAIFRGSRWLISYSSNVCVVGVYGLWSIQCGQLLWNYTFHNNWPLFSFVTGSWPEYNVTTVLVYFVYIFPLISSVTLNTNKEWPKKCINSLLFILHVKVCIHFFGPLCIGLRNDLFSTSIKCSTSLLGTRVFFR